ILSTPTSIANYLQYKLTALDYIIFVVSERVIICKPYCTAVPVIGLDTHLRTCHRVPLKLRRMTIARFNNLPAI
ncbi:hypothetical protein BKA66DRAFT_581759, partial [Pyrenochaeta sp. MPI-SDFR-AT-0127]